MGVKLGEHARNGVLHEFGVVHAVYVEVGNGYFGHLQFLQLQRVNLNAVVGGGRLCYAPNQARDREAEDEQKEMVSYLFHGVWKFKKEGKRRRMALLGQEFGDVLAVGSQFAHDA